MHEGSETITVTGSLSTLTVTDATITITDDDEAPSGMTLSVDADTGTPGTQTSVAEGDSATTARITATVDGSTTYATDQTVTVDVGKSGDSATEGTDYAEIGQQTITIKAGATSGYKDVSLTPIDDSLFEASETISIEGTLIALGTSSKSYVSITLADNDAEPQTKPESAMLRVSPDTVREGDGSTTITVTLTLDGEFTYETAKTVTIALSDSGDTALVTSDYLPVSSVDLTLGAEVSTGQATFRLVTVDDRVSEEPETLTVTGTLEGLTIAPATITIWDDDQDIIPPPPPAKKAMPRLVLTPPAISEAGGVSTVTALLTEPHTKPITLTVGARAVDPATPADFTLSTNRTLTIPKGATSSTGTVTITAVDNTVDAPHKRVTVWAAASNTSAALNPADRSLMITDNECTSNTGRPVVSIEPVNLNAVTEGDRVSFVFNANPCPNADHDGDGKTDNLLVNAHLGSYSTRGEGAKFLQDVDFGLHTAILTANEPVAVFTLTTQSADYQNADGNVEAYLLTPGFDYDGFDRTNYVIPECSSTVSEQNDPTICTYYAARPGKASVPVMDGPDEPLGPTLSIDGDTQVTAGEVATFIIRSSKTVHVCDPNEKAYGCSIASALDDSGKYLPVKVKITLTGVTLVGVAPEFVNLMLGEKSAKLYLQTDFSGTAGTIMVELVDGDGYQVVTEGVISGGQPQARPQSTSTPSTSTPSDGTMVETTVMGMARPTVPTVSVSSVESSVDEGGTVTFTITADPVPTKHQHVYLRIIEEPESNQYVRPDAVLIRAGQASGTWTYVTRSDDVDQDDWKVTASIVQDRRNFYIVNHSSSTVTVTVKDDDTAPETKKTTTSEQDVPPVVTTLDVSSCFSADLLTLVRGYYESNRNQAPTFGENWRRVLIALGDVQDSELTAFTAAEARDAEQVWSGWKPIREALECIAELVTPEESPSSQQAQAPPPPPTPEISISAGSGITEGGSASFTLTASPAPTSALTVSVMVSESGDFGVTTGARTVTIPTSGSQSLSITTSNDATDETDGSITVIVSSGSGYTVSTSASSASVAVSDDDDAPPPPVTPEISISAGSGITEGGSASFTLTASPAPTSALTVSVMVSESGDFGVTTGARTVTIPTSGSQSLSIPTSNDATDETDGSITVIVSSGSGYTVSTSAGSASVGVSDDDDAPPPPPTPEISISAGSGITEGGSASFTLTASPAPTSALTVSVMVSESGDFGATTGARTVTIPTSGSQSLSITTSNDATDESNGSITVTVSSGSGYTVSTSASSASVGVSDDDDAPPPPPTPISTSTPTSIASCVPQHLLDTVRGYYDANRDKAPGFGKNWQRVLVAFGDVQNAELTPFTAAEALEGEGRWSGWRPVRVALECIESA